MQTHKLTSAIATCLAACGSPSGSNAEPDSLSGSAKAESAVLTMRVSRAAHAPVRMDDGRILLIGGCVRESCEAGPDSSTVDLFDARLRTFERAGVLLKPRVSTASALIANDQVFIAGGWVGSTVTETTEIFDVGTGQSRFGGNLSSAKADMALTVLRDGRILLVGGFDGSRAVNAIDVFDPKDGSVRPIGSLATARTGAGAALLRDGKVLVVGGGINGPSDFRPRQQLRLSTLGPNIKANWKPGRRKIQALRYRPAEWERLGLGRIRRARLAR